MKIKLKEITIREASKNYKNDNENGVYGFGGKLNIRPKYQTEYRYDNDHRNAVIETVRSDFPLNTLYWSKNADDTFEIIDGQQRIISICEFVDGNFSIEENGSTKYFQTLTDDEQKKFLDYKLMVYFCEGTDKEKLDWFRIINIAGVKLTEQELKNAVYSGTWLTDAKRHFSKTGCPAYGIASNYLKGAPIRQEYLQTVLKWISKDDIKGYMAKNQHKPNANELWLYFQSVISWTKAVFPLYRREMKGIDFGFLYDEFKDKQLDSIELEKEISRLMEDEDVTKKSGIYEFVLSRKEKLLNIRAFSENQKREAYEGQGGVCANCRKKFEITEMEADHIIPWHDGGKTIAGNCQMLCREDNRIKSGK